MPRSYRIAKIVLAAGLFLAASGMQPASAKDDAQIKRGAYLAKIMDCEGCHTDGALKGEPNPARRLAGSSIGFGMPLGYFYPPNLTPDRDTGLGKWSAADIIKAVKKGVRPDGRELAPVMPWRSYAGLNDRDARALAAYLKSLPPVRHAVPPPTGVSQKAPAPYLSLVVP